MSQAELEWVRLIEELRSRLEASSEEIRRVDHGAGSSGHIEHDGSEASRVLEPETIGSITRTLSKPPAWCLFLFHMVRSFRPDTCLELGTAVGISAAYQCAALSCNGSGRLVTMEGSESLARIASANLTSLGLDRFVVELGRFQDALTPVLNRLGRVEFAYIDGHHEMKATLSYFESILRHTSDGAVIVFDDIDWSSGMREAWESVCRDRRMPIVVDVASGAGSMGVAIVGDEAVRRRRYRLRLADCGHVSTS